MATQVNSFARLSRRFLSIVQYSSNMRQQMRHTRQKMRGQNRRTNTLHCTVNQKLKKYTQQETTIRTRGTVLDTTTAPLRTQKRSEYFPAPC